MQGDADVLSYLNRYVRVELTGHKQYLMNAALCRHWDFHVLADKQQAYSAEETAHAQRLIARMLFLGGTPEPSDYRPITPPAEVRTQLEQDADLVGVAITLLREAVTCCSERNDAVSRDLFREMLDDEEQHLHWLHTELALLTRLGEAPYLQSRM